ncbi:DNA-3-methyladenine glycosylase [Pedobacter sp. L105]|uniref:DNA-3-methyladenine glycosylase family protein n=1 Tax=Pedobacter sp. L105 TaxID=1641871 RepID=UPI00131C2AF4|nr:DNA-3-methyladenine glycosylase 2 family protein [Pedobacter sp. L105]
MGRLKDIPLATFSSENFFQTCDLLASADDDLLFIIQTYGYPPMWTRPNTFETLVHIILEQQVSLASALAALNKLREKINEITPARVLLLNDEELKSCYFSRQKMSYVRYLAEAVVSGALDLTLMENLPDDEVRSTLNQLKGVGNWTIDVYLMFVLHRTDIFPIGDLAAVNALKQLKKLRLATPREDLLTITTNWQPYRTIATMLLWHYYLSLRAKKQKI